MKKRLHVQLTYRQQLLLALFLVIMLAVSLLYCLGFASLALRQAVETGPPDWASTGFPEDLLDVIPVQPSVELTPSPTVAP